MVNVSVQEILVLNGLIMMLIGALAFQASGGAANAISSLYFGNGCAVVSFLLAGGVGSQPKQRGEVGYRLMMICVHLAIVFPVVVGGAVSWRLALALRNPEKSYVIPYFAAMIVMSVVTLAIVVSHKPKKEAKKEDNSDTAQVKEPSRKTGASVQEKGTKAQ